MTKYKTVGTLPSRTYFRLSDEPGDQAWFRVRRHVEDYVEIQPVLENGDLGTRRLMGGLSPVVPMSIATIEEESNA